MGKKLLPVIHYLDLKTTETNIKICLDNGCDGVFIINMNCSKTKLDPAAELAKKIGGDNFFVGINRLGGNVINDILNNKLINGLWVDNPGLYSNEELPITKEINNALLERWISNPNFNFFGSVAFKTQREEFDYATVAKKAKEMSWVVTTSGPETGIPADIQKIKIMKESIGHSSLAIASGITPENVDEFLPYVDYYLVATGISNGFYHFDEAKVKQLSNKIKNY